MARPKAAAVTLAEFVEGLRQLRRAAGSPGYRALARRAGYAPTTLWGAASGCEVPTLAVTLAYVGACGGDSKEWEERWYRLKESRATAAAPGVAGTAAAADCGPARPTPRQLPSDVYGFTGRSSQLAQLDALVESRARNTAVLAGTAGVGKTALAVHWAHRVADRFPDGQLYLDLRGYDPEQPVLPADALAAALRALGVPGDEIPNELAERAARYRTLLSERRILIVLDNAYAVEQVRPLLPGSGCCVTVVTSRDSLTGLVARHGACRIDLDLLSPAEGVDLLRALIGDRVDVEPEAAAATVERCARLPLALRIAAELVAARPSMSLKKLIAELAEFADEHGAGAAALDLFEAGEDDRTAVRTVFSWSYRRLPAAAARLFRLFGLSPGTELDVYAAAALVGTDRTDGDQQRLDARRLAGARHVLDTLVRAHLVQFIPVGAVPDIDLGRYRMHDLLRAYAAECASAEETGADQRAALTRLLHHYLATATTATNALYAPELTRQPRIPAACSPIPPVQAPAAAQAWLDAERENLVAVIGYAAGRGSPTQAGYLAGAIGRYLDMGAHYDDCLTVYRHGLHAAREHGDRFGEARARHGLGQATYRLGRYDEAVDNNRRAAAIFRELGDPVRAVQALANLGIVYSQLRRYTEALTHYRQALDMYREIGDDLHAAMALGWVGLELGRLGRFDEAVDHLERALADLRRIGYPMREAEALYDLGQVHLWAGKLDEAIEYTRQSLALGREADDRYRETDALNALGEILCAAGRFDEAGAEFRSALRLAVERRQRDEHARALDGIAGVRRAAGDLHEARRYWHEALSLYTELSMPDADDVRARLAAIA